MNTDIHTYTHRSSCPEYAIAAYVLLPFVMAPFLLLAYLLHRGVTRHSVYIFKGGNLYSRFKEAMEERRDMWGKWYGLGFLLALKASRTDARENGEWKVCHCVSIIHIYIYIHYMYVYVYVCICMHPYIIPQKTQTHAAMSEKR
jgi:hypothetical protein